MSNNLNDSSGNPLQQRFAPRAGGNLYNVGMVDPVEYGYASGDHRQPSFKKKSAKSCMLSKSNF